MPQWDEFHGWMRFVRLDDSIGLTNAFTIGYRFNDDPTEDWTRRFNAFKERQETALYGGLNVMTAAVPQLLDGLRIKPSKTAMIPALKSGESKARKRGVLAVIARAVAKSAGIRFVRDAVRKEPHPPIHTTRSAVERSEMLDQAGYESSAIDADTILVFDDFITRGSTLSHIAQAILRENPRVRVYGLALCKTEGRVFNRDRFGVELSNDHVPSEWRTLWDRGK